MGRRPQVTTGQDATVPVAGCPGSTTAALAPVRAELDRLGWRRPVRIGQSGASPARLADTTRVGRGVIAPAVPARHRQYVPARHG